MENSQCRIKLQSELSKPLNIINAVVPKVWGAQEILKGGGGAQEVCREKKI
jgi:hypothetical protein